MKNRIFVAIAFLAGISGLAASPARAAHSRHSSWHSNGPFGLGVVIGEPTGLSAKYRFSSHDAVDFGLAYSFNSFVEVFADYLYHFPGAFGSPSPFVAELTPYLGIGGIFFADTGSGRRDTFFTGSGASAGLGLRIPLGIEWRPGSPPLGIFVELVPGLGIIPSTFGFLQGGIGIRFYF